MGGETEFGDLRHLADWFASLSSSNPRPRALHIERIVKKLGQTCVPLLGRELCALDPRRRDAARAALAHLATTPAKLRVIDALRSIAATSATDEGKVCALGLLAELGQRGAARFSDPDAMQRRSAIALAAQLDSPADVAAAADMMIRQLAHDEMIQLLAVMALSAPAAAQRLGSELCIRLDLAAEIREQIAEVSIHSNVGDDCDEIVRRGPRPTLVSVLVDAAARLVVIACRKVSGQRKWRRWAVLIDAEGHVDDCIHEDDAEIDGAPLVAQLVGDGYRVASSDLEHGRAIVAAAARVSAWQPSTDSIHRLESAYYLGRDLLDLGDAHLGARGHADPASSRLGRAVELLAEGDPARAHALLARCDSANADVAAAIAACFFAQSQPAEAIVHLVRAIDAEPDWALHHWNLAAAYHQLGDDRACYHALRRFVATSALPTGLYADPDQPGRVGLAERLLLQLERTARLTGTPLARRNAKRKRATKRQRSR